MSIKLLYEFEINEKVKKQKPIEKEIDGQKVTVLEDVIEEVPVKFAIKKPSRSKIEEGDIIYASTFGNLVSLGLITKAQLTKKLIDSGGLLSKNEEELYISSYNELQEKLKEARELSDKENKTPEENKKETDLIMEINKISKRINDFESVQTPLFENTADVKARNKSITWFTTELAMKKVGEEYKPIFDGFTENEKLDKLDQIYEDIESIDAQAVMRISECVSLWYFGKASKQDEFELYF